MKLFVVMLMLVVFMGCDKKTPSERTGYLLACDALRADTTLPASVKPLPIEDAGLYISKNAGYVVLRYEDGTVTNGKYVVRLKRVARTWMLDEVVKGTTKIEEQPVK
ncbi:MAG: hypothetical protein KAI74_04580 [Kiritimatiellae bacterium]|nr:hypothetical protein [Kiritimatiellia bacterium]